MVTWQSTGLTVLAHSITGQEMSVIRDLPAGVGRRRGRSRRLERVTRVDKDAKHQSARASARRSIWSWKTITWSSGAWVSATTWSSRSRAIVIAARKLAA